MTVSYAKLWAILEERFIGKIEMRRDCKIAPITFIKMTRGEPLPEKHIKTICEYLSVMPEDIMEIIPDQKKE